MMLQIKNKKIIKIILTTFICVPFLASAATYNLLEPITGATTVTTDNNGIETYIRTGYKYLLGLTIALSVLMIVLGGVEYTTAFASETAAGSAKKRIENAVTGLLIALLSYAALYMINPNLTNMSLPNIEECKEETKNTAPIPGKATTVKGNAVGTGVAPVKAESATTKKTTQYRIIDGVEYEVAEEETP